ncbi:MAG TPA: hypothetical protein ENI23_02435, partial [bacterium]|nr:hypothetical protein [bacterium]
MYTRLFNIIISPFLHFLIPNCSIKLVLQKYQSPIHKVTQIRYYLISRSPENKDYDFTWEDFVDAV